RGTFQAPRLYTTIKRETDDSVVEPDQGREAAGLALVTEGIEQVGATVGAVVAAVHISNAGRRQTLSCQCRQVHAPVSWAVRNKAGCRTGIMRQERISDRVIHLVAQHADR